MNLRTDEVEKVADIGNILVKDLIFENDSVGYASVRFSNYARDGGFLKTIDGGVSWDIFEIRQAYRKGSIIKRQALLSFLQEK